jgi:hypothetical protein
MAELSKNPTGWEMEDLVAAYFVSRGCYVEKGVKERNPEEIGELDLVWTDYRRTPPTRHPVEVKAGEWGLGDIFKFYGWTRYLDLEPGEFIHVEPFGRTPATLSNVQKKSGLTLLHVPDPDNVETHFKALGFAEPHWADLPKLWRYSFWGQRRLLKAIQEAIRQRTCFESAKAAKNYYHLINDAAFFAPDAHSRISALLAAHLEHQGLGATAACEIETGTIIFKAPPQTNTFRRAYIYGSHFPVQTCLYLAHRARLYILKAIVDYWMAKAPREVPEISKQRRAQVLLEQTVDGLTPAMISAIDTLSKLKSFPLLPVFWQTFLWSWGGFLLKDSLQEEYADLAKETGVPIAEIPAALGAFDMLFPTTSGWFREMPNDSRKVLILMPAAMRGIGSYRRLLRTGKDEYSELGYKDATTNRLADDHNVGVRILECPTAELIK